MTPIEFLTGYLWGTLWGMASSLIGVILIFILEKYRKEQQGVKE